MAPDEVRRAYSTRAAELAGMLGTVVSLQDPDRAVIEPWAQTVPGRILDVGSGTGRWAGRLADLGHDVEGLEPVGRFVQIARWAHPGVTFRQAALADLVGSAERWSGVLAWYSLIHLRPEELPTALSTVRAVLEDSGSLLLSFFAGPRLEAFPHPATTAYRWPMETMTRAVERAGFAVTDAQERAEDLHAHIRARARAPLATGSPSGRRDDA